GTVISPPMAMTCHLGSTCGDDSGFRRHPRRRFPNVVGKKNHLPTIRRLRRTTAPTPSLRTNLCERHLRRCTEDAAKVAAEDAAKVAAEDAAKDAAEDAAKDAVEDAAKDAVEDAAKVAAEDAAEVAAEDAAKDAVEDAAKDAVEDAAKDAAEAFKAKVQRPRTRGFVPRPGGAGWLDCGQAEPSPSPRSP